MIAERGLVSLGEVIVRKGKGRRLPDILVLLNGLRLNVEGKKVGSWDALKEQGIRRLEEDVCDICALVEYVEVETSSVAPTQVDLKNSLMRGKFNLAFLSYADIAGLRRWDPDSVQLNKLQGVAFSELLTYLMNVYSQASTYDVIVPIVERMEATLAQFSTRLSNEVNTDRLKDVLELTEPKREEENEREE